MQRSKFSAVSLSEIAKAAGVSKTTVSYVMRNSPGPSKSSREHVLKVARELGYSPDARVSSWMAQIRDAKDKDLQPIIWLAYRERWWQEYKFLSPYLEGATEQARQLGYRIEMLAVGDQNLSMRRLSQIIFHRGIEGVVATHSTISHFILKWESMAGVTLEKSTSAPRLNNVHTDTFYNLLLALKMLRRLGYRRIGVCLEGLMDRSSFHAIHAGLLYFLSKLPMEERVEPLFYIRRGKNDEARDVEVREALYPWLKSSKPDVVVCHHNHMERWLTEGGYRIPEDLGLVHLATDDDVNDWAGIHSKRREIGATSIRQVVSLMQNRQFGLPQTMVRTSIRGVWHGGRTLIVPKPR